MIKTMPCQREPIRYRSRTFNHDYFGGLNVESFGEEIEFTWLLTGRKRRIAEHMQFSRLIYERG